MKRTSHLQAVILLLCMLAAIVPFNLFHHHSGTVYCDGSDAALELDPCHVSIYHGNSSGADCSHQSHVTNIHDDCKGCKTLASERFFSKSSITEGIVLPFAEFLYSLNNINAGNDSGIFISGRSPPAC